MDAADDWLAVFAAQLPDASALAQISAATLRTQLLSLHRQGQLAWPSVDFPLQSVAAHVGRHCPKEVEIEAGLAALRGTDLFLAGACATGNIAALRAFDEHFLRQLPMLFSRMNPTAAFVDEMRQVLREMLLTAQPGRSPKIAEYSGRGSLTSWLRVTAVRAAVRQRRSKGEQMLANGNDVPLEAVPNLANPELAYLKEHYKKEFRTAFHSALQKLTAEQRNLLRMHLVDGLNIEQIGALMHVHRATVARWIAGAREGILDNVRCDLQERLRLQNEEFESLVNLVRSQLHISIVRILEEKQTVGS